MTKSTESTRANRSLHPLIELTVLGMACLLVLLPERLTAQVCPELPIFGGEKAFEWDQGFQPVNQMASFSTSADGLTMYFDRLGGDAISKTQRETTDQPWSNQPSPCARMSASAGEYVRGT